MSASSSSVSVDQNNSVSSRLRKRKLDDEPKLPDRKLVESKEIKKTSEKKVKQIKLISATKLMNSALKDPLIDFLEEFRDSIDVKTSDGKQIEVKCNLDDNEFTKMLMNKGTEFEHKVIDELKRKYQAEFVTIVTEPTNYDIEVAKEATLNAMKAGVKLIYQGEVVNYGDGSHGLPDLLVRCDVLNTLVTMPMITDDELKITAKNLPHYFYVVVDIKWSKLHLTANGINLCNEFRMPGYKMQLCVYNRALGEMQGYTPTKAYILGKQWHYTCRREEFKGTSCFDRLGVIDFEGFDNKYLELADQAIVWRKDLITDGENWTLNPPSREELYPNMKNDDIKWSTFKHQLASELKDITMLWYCGVDKRKNAHEKGVFRWDDRKCTVDALGYENEDSTICQTLKEILRINRPECKELITNPVLNNDYHWQSEGKLEFYVDFETIPKVMTSPVVLDAKEIKDDVFPVDVVVLAGLGWCIDNKFNYKAFVSTGLDEKSITSMYNEFYTYMSNICQPYLRKNKKKQFNIYHWGNLEQTIHHHMNKNNANKWNMKNLTWVNFCKIATTEPIVVKGSLAFGLKDIGKAMYSHGMIPTTWADEKHNGQWAMVQMFKCYSQLAPNENILENDVMKEIIGYNEVDCRVVCDIIHYLRANCISDDVVINGKSESTE